MPLYPPTLSITYNQTKLVPSLLVDASAHAKVGTLFALMVDRIKFIVNLISTILNNYI